MESIKHKMEGLIKDKKEAVERAEQLESEKQEKEEKAKEVTTNYAQIAIFAKFGKIILFNSFVTAGHLQQVALPIPMFLFFVPFVRRYASKPRLQPVTSLKGEGALVATILENASHATHLQNVFHL